jgi:hypothetical protein
MKVSELRLLTYSSQSQAWQVRPVPLCATPEGQIVAIRIEGTVSGIIGAAIQPPGPEELENFSNFTSHPARTGV